MSTLKTHPGLLDGVHYSGQDINVFVYRDIPELIEKQDYNRNDNAYEYSTTPVSGGKDVSSQRKEENKKNNPPKGNADDVNDSAGQTNVRSENASKNPNSTSSKNVGSVTAANYSPIIRIGTLSELSYSSFREKFAVRTLGRTHAKTYTRGPRTVAGTMTFNTVQENELLAFAKEPGNIDGITIESKNVLMDQIDPFHMMLVFGNEYGAFSVMYIFNVEFGSESQRMSINDLVLQNNVSFYATDMIPMQSSGNMFASYSDMINGQVQSNLPSSSFENGDFSVKKKIDQFMKNNPDEISEIDKLLQRSRGLF